MDFRQGDTMPMFVACALSAICCALIMITHTLFPTQHNKPSKQMIFYLALANMLAAIGTIVGQPRNNSYACWYQATASNLFYQSTVLWTDCICFTIFTIVVTQQHVEMRKEFHWLCWGLPTITTLLPLTNATFGSDGAYGWCWIIPSTKTTPFAMLFWYWESFYFVMWTGMAVTIIYFVRIIRHMPNISPDARESVINALKKLRFYPVIFVVCWTIPILHSNILYFSPSIPLKNLFGTIANVAPCLQGFFTGIVYWLTSEDVRDLWYNFYMTHETSITQSNQFLTTTMEEGGLSLGQGLTLAENNNKPQPNHHHHQHQPHGHHNHTAFKMSSISTDSMAVFTTSNRIQPYSPGSKLGSCDDFDQPESAKQLSVS